MDQADISALKAAVLEQPDFPTPGTTYRSFWPIWVNTKLRHMAISGLVRAIKDLDIQFDYVAGLESRGYPIADALANELKVDLLPICKPGKLPPPTVRKEFFIPYRNKTECLETRRDWAKPGARVFLVDDLLDSGASFMCARELVELCGGKAVGAVALLELQGNGGREALSKLGVPVTTLITFDHEKKKAKENKKIETLVISPEDDYRIVIMAHPSMMSTAETLVRYAPKLFRIAKVQWEYFRDGYPNIKFEALRASSDAAGEHGRMIDSLCNRHVLLLLSLYDRAQFLEQASLLRVLPRQDIKSLTVWLPYMAPATFERVDVDGDVATAEPVAKLLSAGMPFTINGPVTFINVDIHALQERFYYTDDIRPLFVSAIPTLIRELEAYDDPTGGMVTIAFPDDGADKRFGKMFRDRPIIVCSKERIGDKRIIRIKEVKNCASDDARKRAFRRVIICDDILHSGGTLVECHGAIQQEAKRLGITNGQIWVYVTHGVFDQGNHVEFATGGKRNIFDKIITTTTVPEVAHKIDGTAPFQVLNLAPLLLRKVLDRTDTKYTTDDILPHLPRRVWVASENKDKIKAVEMAYSSLRLFGDLLGKGELQVQGIACDDVEGKRPNQPIGMEQTRYAAECRLKQLDSLPMAKFELLVAVENGLLQDKATGKWFDTAFVIVALPGSTKTYRGANSVGVPVPDDIMEIVLAHKGTKTAGECFKEKYGYDSSNWHVHFGTGVSRTKLIADALTELLDV